jgi:Zn-dependent protease
MLGVFNLMPFPPLDGSKVVASLLPVKLEYYFYKYEKYFYLILIFLIATRGISRILGPLVDFVYSLIINLLI